MWWCMVGLAFGAKLKTEVKEELTHPTLFGAVVSVRVDDDRGRTVYSRGSEQRLVPASTVKWLTAIAAVDKLGFDYRFATTVQVTGEVDGTTLNGDVYWVGDGDPSLGEEDPDAVLDEIVNTLVASGIRRVQGALIIDASAISDPPLGNGWMWDDLKFGFSAPYTGLNLGRNLGGFRAFLDEEACETVEDRRGGPLVDPIACFSATLEARLADAGVRFTEDARQGPVPVDATEFVRIESAPLGELVSHMLLESDNLYAECLFRAVDPAPDRTHKGVSAWLDGLFERAGITPAYIRLADGSGLSRYSLVSADTLVELTDWAVVQEWGPELIDRLPIAGVSGTLEERTVGTPAEGRVWAKTGSMSGVRNLVGVVEDAKGRNVRFAILFNGVAAQRAAIDVQDRILTLLSISRRRRIRKADLKAAFPTEQ